MNRSSHKTEGVNRIQTMRFHPFVSTGKERDAETGYSYFGARYYSSDLSVWLSVVPMADKYPSISPYAYCANNPMRVVDPDGDEISPIYDTEGVFLGTDNLGLQGDAIIMKASDFKQNMSHQEALLKGRTLDNLSDEEALAFANNNNFVNFLNHYSNLSNRPDWDGFLSLSEANEWYRKRNGVSLFVDASLIDLDPVYANSIQPNETRYVNYASLSELNFATGLIYGTLKLTGLTNEGAVRIGGEDGLIDNYGFEMHPGRPLRNIKTKIGSWVAGKGVPYNIYGYGNGQLKNKK